MRASTIALMIVTGHGLVASEVAWAADKIEIVIRTHIDAPDPQAGMKSEQIITIDFATSSHSTSFRTGVTKLIGAELGSVRDKFKVQGLSFANGFAKFEASGQTASGILFMPNIDYKFQLSVDRNGMGSISGCHDGYPSYDVTVAGTTAHAFKHGRLDLIKLFGSCDNNVPIKPFRQGATPAPAPGPRPRQ